jgi:protein-tyrosine phosphatase
MADRKPLLSRLVVRVALVALLIYLGVVAVGRYYAYCDYRMTMSPMAALKRTATTMFDPASETPDRFPASRYSGEGNFSEIEPGFFVGGSVPKPPPGAQAVLNLCEVEDPYQAETHVWMKIPDSSPAPELPWLKEAVDFVAKERKEGKIVYVHCAAGISRAGMVSTAYVMAEKGWTRDKALAFVREQRPQVNPNQAFMDRLLEWEKVVAAEK